MKPISELKISPRPWLVGDKFPYGEDNVIYCHYTRDDGKKSTRVVAQCNQYFAVHAADALMMRAAPEMYECLLEAVEDKCRKCKASWYGECVTADGKDCEVVRKWKSVLAKAAGEGQNHGA